jgi:hypothetical protein
MGIVKYIVWQSNEYKLLYMNMSWIICVYNLNWKEKTKGKGR